MADTLLQIIVGACSGAAISKIFFLEFFIRLTHEAINVPTRIRDIRN